MAYREAGGLKDGLRIIAFSVVATNNAVDHAQAPASLNDRKYPATVALPSYINNLLQQQHTEAL